MWGGTDTLPTEGALGMVMNGDWYDYYDRKFFALTVPIADVEEFYSGCRWAEGPVWFTDGDCPVWSDIPNRRLLRWVPDLGVGGARRNRLFITANKSLYSVFVGTRDSQMP